MMLLATSSLKYSIPKSEGVENEDIPLKRSLADFAGLDSRENGADPYVDDVPIRQRGKRMKHGTRKSDSDLNIKLTNISSCSNENGNSSRLSENERHYTDVFDAESRPFSMKLAELANSNSSKGIHAQKTSNTIKRDESFQPIINTKPTVTSSTEFNILIHPVDKGENFSLTKFLNDNYLTRTSDSNAFNVLPDEQPTEERCSICHKTISSPFNLTQMLNRTNSITPTCEDCCVSYSKSEPYSENSALRKYTTPHTDIQSFPCDGCNKCFTSRQSLERHSMLMHTSGINLFSCEACNESFAMKHDLIQHMQMHSSPVRTTRY